MTGPLLVHQLNPAVLQAGITDARLEVADNKSSVFDTEIVNRILLKEDRKGHHDALALKVVQYHIMLHTVCRYQSQKPCK